MRQDLTYKTSGELIREGIVLLREGWWDEAAPWYEVILSVVWGFMFIAANIFWLVVETPFYE